MVSAEEEEALRVFDFVGEEEADRLDAVFSSVDVVSQE